VRTYGLGPLSERGCANVRDVNPTRPIQTSKSQLAFYYIYINNARTYNEIII